MNPFSPSCIEDWGWHEAVGAVWGHHVPGVGDGNISVERCEWQTEKLILLDYMKSFPPLVEAIVPACM